MFLTSIVTALASIVSSFYEPSYKGAGVILFKDSSLLLVQNRLTGRWSFPKGHREPSDTTWRQTAIREVFEESGYLLDVDYTLSENATEWGNRLYWQGRVVSEKTPQLLESEHSSVAWFPLNKKQPLQLRLGNDVRAWNKAGRPVHI